MKKKQRNSLAVAMSARAGKQIMFTRTSINKPTAVAVKSGKKWIIKTSNGIAIV